MLRIRVPALGGGAGGGDITGTAAITVAGPQVAGAGTVALPPAITGTGAVGIAGPQVAATGTVSAPPITGTGQVAIAGPVVSGSGTVSAPAAISGTAAVTIAGPSAAGTGTVGAPGITGTGAVSIQGPQVSAAGTVADPSTITETGAVSIRGPSAAGAGGLGTGPWDLSSAAYNGVNFSVSAQATSPVGVAFSSDGTRMFVANFSNQEIYQYDLSTAWDAGTAAYGGVSFSTAGQIANNLNGLTFSADGTKMYAMRIAGAGVFQYTLSTPWALNTASYSGLSFNASAQTNSPSGIAVRPDGAKFYLVGADTSTIFQYSMSTPGNISSGSYDGISFSVSGPSGVPFDLIEFFGAIAFKPDGTRLYVSGQYLGSGKVFEFGVSTAWVISSAVYSGVSLSVAQTSTPNGIAFRPDGTRMYVALSSTDRVYQYDFYIPPIPAITGSGAVFIAGPTVAGTGSATAAEITATGDVTIAGPSLAGAGTAAPPPITGSGGIVIKGPAVSGAGCVNDELTWVGATMPFTAKTILESAAVILSDAGGNRWPWPELLSWLSGALREIAIIKPSATADVIEVQLQCGTKQRVPAGYHQMLDATRNLLTSACSPTGRSGGQAITTVTRDEIDAAIPGWHNPAVLPYAKAVHHVVDADADPMTFYVVPGNDGTGLIEITASVMPAALPIPANPDLIESYANINIPMPNAYEEAVLNFVIYRALSKDSMVAGAAARASAHLALFQQTLGIKQEREDTQSVNRPTHRHSR